MPKRASSGTKGLFKRHRGCTNRGPLTSCACAWYGKYRGKEVTLSKWARCTVDPHTKTVAIKVLTRVVAAVDDGTFDAAGERPPLGTAEP